MRSKFKWIFTLLLAFSMQFSFAQEKTITGVVSDQAGPLPGASVQVQGTTRGTQTDFDGKYSIKASVGETLLITYTGYNSFTSVVGAASIVNAKLQDGIDINEVVVTAFGIKREAKELTYASKVIDEKLLNQAAPVNAVTAMAGKVSGLNLTTLNNGVNPTTMIVLRGYKSITGNNQALIVIDGVVQAYTALDNLNPNDIASVNTLKGAAATALYGSQGANGALIVTTKQGGNKKMEVNFNSSLVIEQVKYFPELQSSFGMGYDNEYYPYENTNWGPRYDGVPRRLGPILADGSYQVVPYSPIKNNRKNFFVDGVTSINGLSISGGDEKSTYFFSAQHTDVDGITPNDQYTKDNFRFNGSRSGDKFKITTNVSFFRDKSDVAAPDGGYQTRGIYWNVLNTPGSVPLTSYKNWRTDTYATPETYYNEYYQNPYMIADIARNRAEANRLYSNVKLEYDITSWIKASYSLAGTFYNRYNQNTREAVTYNGLISPSRTASNTPAAFVDASTSDSRINSDFLLSFDRKITEDFTAKLILGNSVFSYQQKGIQLGGNNLFVPGLYAPSVRTGELTGALTKFQERTSAYFADLTLKYKGFLTLNGAYRYDKSSTLPLEANGFDFYTYGAVVDVTNAIPGLKGDYVNFINLRGSYASVGSSPTNVRGSSTRGFLNELYSTPAGFPFGSTIGLGVPTAGATANLTPEFTKTMEFGIDMAFFNNRLDVKANYYVSNTTDQFNTLSVSAASGMSLYKLNSGEVENKGFELDVDVTVLRNEDFTWKIGGNLSKIKNKVISLGSGVDRAQVGLASTGDQTGIYAQVGQSYPSIFAPAYVRDDAGRVIIDQSTGDPVISSELKNLGQTTPDLILGFNTSFTYKGITLSAVADYKTGHVYYNSMVDALEFTGLTQHSASAGRLPFVFPNSSYESAPGVYTANTNITTSGGGSAFWNSQYNPIKENYVVDASTFKLREVALSYDLPAKYLDKTFIKGVNFGLVARNILMLRSAANKYTDPEFTNDGQQVTGFGTLDQLPPTGSYGFKLNVKF